MTISAREKAAINWLFGSGIALVWIAQAIQGLILEEQSFLRSATAAAEAAGLVLTLTGVGTWVNARQNASERPALLGGFFVLAALFTLIALPLLFLAPVDIGTYVINGQQVSGPEFLATGGAIFVAGIAILVAVMVAIQTNSPVSRPLIIVPLALALGMLDVLAAWHGELTVTRVLRTVAVIAILVWYFYFKRTVVTYYQRTAQTAPQH